MELNWSPWCWSANGDDDRLFVIRRHSPGRFDLTMSGGTEPYVELSFDTFEAAAAEAARRS
jgi:hypothetical protein